MADVLVVDANQSIRQMFVAGLSGFGFTVQESESYQKAQAILNDGDVPYVAIVDFQRTNEEASAFLKYLQQTPEYSNIKVIVATVNQLSDDEQKALGVNAVMTKPVDLSKLVKAVYLYHRPDADKS